MKRQRQQFREYRLYRTVARYRCDFDIGARGKHPADGEFYGLSCGIVCGESGGRFYPAPNAIDGYGQWIASSWSRWAGAARSIERRLERRYSVRLHFGARAGSSGELEQHVVAWLSDGNDTWYGYKPPSVCR